jgi:hypothetical protein
MRDAGVGLEGRHVWQLVAVGWLLAATFRPTFLLRVNCQAMNEFYTTTFMKSRS